MNNDTITKLKTIAAAVKEEEGWVRFYKAMNLPHTRERLAELYQQLRALIARIQNKTEAK